MESFNNLPLWDLSTQPTQYSELPDDEFLAILQKQFQAQNDGQVPALFSFPTTSAPENDGVNPQALSSQPLSFGVGETPPLTDDSSPSPPSMPGSSRSRRQSAIGGDAGDGLKRKATEDDDLEFEEGPSHKNPHSDKRIAAIGHARRKSSGGPEGGKDEARLLRRKEQNRAAQRAFRERKEKHVKDLEDKVAALEEAQRQSTAENENLRDLLTRLQSENVQLKQGQFTFSVPHGAQAGPGPSTEKNSQYAQSPTAAAASPGNLFSQAPLGQPAAPPAAAMDDIDWNSLTAFDPSALNVFDESPPDTTMSSVDDSASQGPYKTIISAPMFMSFADPSPASYGSSNSNAGTDQFWSPISSSSSGGAKPVPSHQSSLDTPIQSWSPPAANAGWSPMAMSNQPSSNGAAAQPDNNFEDLFGSGSFTLSQSPMDFWSFAASPPAQSSQPNPISPISHQSSMGSSPSISGTHRGSISSSTTQSQQHNEKECPRTREELAKIVDSQGGSMFTEELPAPVAMLRKGNATNEEQQQIFCAGSNFPRVKQSTDNVEVLAAWRSITSNPQFKDVDINDLCSEFTSKAKCDGTKVVLEPSGVSFIIDKLKARIGGQ